MPKYFFIGSTFFFLIVVGTLFGENKKENEKRHAIMEIDIIRLRQKAIDIEMTRIDIVEAVSKLIEADKDQAFSYREIGEWRIGRGDKSARFQELVDYDLKIVFDAK